MTPDQLKDLQARASRPRRTVPVVCDGDLAQRIDALQAEMDELVPPEQADKRLASKPKPARVAEATAELDALYERAAASTLYVVLEGLQDTVFRALVAQHKVLKDDKDRTPWGPDGVDRFAMEEPLIRACVVGHRESLEAEELHPLPAATLDWLLGFTQLAQKETLFLAAWSACRGDDAVPLRRARSQTPSSASA